METTSYQNIDLQKNEAEKHGKSRKTNFFQTASKRLLANPAYVKDCYSGKPQAVLKIAGFGCRSGVKRMLFYIARVDRPDKAILEIEDSSGNRIYGKEAVEQLYETWKQSFDSRAGKNRHSIHVVLSAAAENNPKNLNRVLAAARSTAHKQFCLKGYNYAIGLHQDGSNPHVHLIVKNTHDYGGKKLVLNPPDLLEIRQDFAKELSDLGLEHSATRKIHTIEFLKTVKDNVKIKERLKIDISAAGNEILYQNIPIKAKEQAFHELKIYSKALDKSLKANIYKENKKTIEKKLRMIRMESKRKIKPEKPVKNNVPEPVKPRPLAPNIGNNEYIEPANVKEGLTRVKGSLKQLKEGGLNVNKENKLVNTIDKDLKFLKSGLPNKKTLRSVQRYNLIFDKVHSELTDKAILPPDKKTMKKLREHFSESDLTKIKKQRYAEILLASLKTEKQPEKEKTLKRQRVQTRKKDMDISR